MKLKLSGEVCSTDGFFQDLFEGNIDVEALLEDGSERVLEAIEVIQDFHDLLEEKDLLELY